MGKEGWLPAKSYAFPRLCDLSLNASDDLSGIRAAGHRVEKFCIYFAASFPMLITKRIMIIRYPKILRFDFWFTMVMVMGKE